MPENIFYYQGVMWCFDLFQFFHICDRFELIFFSLLQVFAFKAEALLKLHRHEEADTVVSAAQKVETTLRKCRNVTADTTMLLVQSEIDMALGRSVFNLLCHPPLSSITLQKQPKLRILFKCSFGFVAFCGNPSRERHAHIWKILT